MDSMNNCAVNTSVQDMLHRHATCVPRGDVGAPGHNHLAEWQLLLGEVIVCSEDGEDKHAPANQQQHHDDGKHGHGRTHKCVLQPTSVHQLYLLIYRVMHLHVLADTCC